MHCLWWLMIIFLFPRIKMSAGPYNYSYIFKYIIIGDMGVGKSCLLHQFTEKKCKYGNILCCLKSFAIQLGRKKQGRLGFYKNYKKNIIRQICSLDICRAWFCASQNFHSTQMSGKDNVKFLIDCICYVQMCIQLVS